MLKNETSQWWWLESHQTSGRSQWLQSTVGELDRKTKAMLKLIEEDADSFAQRAEMYYKKRPELISMVENFYREHRSLAERYDLLKSDSAHRLLTTLGTPFSAKYQPCKLTNLMDHASDNQSEIYDAEDSAESEVDDPEQLDDVKVETFGEIEEELEQTNKSEASNAGSNEELMNLKKEVEKLKEENRVHKDELLRKDDEKQKWGSQVEERHESEASNAVSNEELIKLKKEIEKLKEENRLNKDRLFQKDEEKREVIRQLSLAIEMLKSENVQLRHSLHKITHHNRFHSTVDRLKDALFRKMGSRKSE